MTEKEVTRAVKMIREYCQDISRGCKGCPFQTVASICLLEGGKPKHWILTSDGEGLPRSELNMIERLADVEQEVAELARVAEELKSAFTMEVELEKADKWRTWLLALKKIYRILKSECGAEVKRPGFVDDLRQAIKNRKGE